MRSAALLGGLAAALVLAALTAAGVGAYPVPLPEVAGSVLHRLGLPLGPLPDQIAQTVLWEVRAPRVLLALLVGACLGGAGALMQGVFANPLAEPGVIGVSSGAAVGAVVVIFFGLSAFGYWTVILAAFAAGMATTLFVYACSRSGGRTEVVTLLLMGVAVNALAGAVIGLFVNFSQNAELQSITQWQLGSVGAANWAKVLAILPFAVLGCAAAPLFARRLDLLALGEGPARHLGVDVERLRMALIVLVALLTSAAVAFAGVVTFVGLVVPHMIRMVAGPGHRLLIPGGVLGGALVVVLADLAARTVAAPAEIPLGVLTALIGGPFFFYLLRRTRARHGGWA
nr:iron ABC transporter permease [Allonocardiopsis opalescens]